MTTLVYWAFAFIVGTLAVARVTRLVVDDDFPPVVWLRERYAGWAGERWGTLVECPFCLGFWIALADTAWAFGAELHWTWWAVNITFASAYVAAMITVRDIPKDDRQ